MTGSTDCTASIIDLRTCKLLTSLIHRGPVNCVEFSPNKEHITASSDDILTIWSFNNSEADILWKHFGHKSPITDFNWNFANEGVLSSVSDDSQQTSQGGGNLHIYRPNDLMLEDKSSAIEDLCNSLEGN